MSHPSSLIKSDVPLLDRQRRPWFRVVVLAGLLTLVGSMLFPWQRQSGDGVVVLGADASASAEGDLRGEISTAVRCLHQVAPRCRRAVLYRLDYTATVFLDGPLPSRPSALRRLFEEQLLALPERPGTNTPAFWKEAVRIASVTNQPTAVILLTDGDIDDQSAPALQRLQTYASRLAGRKNLRFVGIWGVHPGNLARWEHLFRPLGSRLSVRTTPDDEFPGVVQALR